MTRRDVKRRRTARARRSGPIGVLAILIVAVLGFIAYRANDGLPLESRYDVNVLVPDADRLINAADVRIGGVLVGEVLHVGAVPGRDGRAPEARVKLAIDDSVGRLPIDTTVQVRPLSVLGLTYVDLTLGVSRQTVPPNGTLPLSAALPSSDLTDLFQIFNRRSAQSFQQAASGLAAGLAGRGSDINTTIGATAQLLPSLTRVAGALSAPTTQLPSFISGYAAFTNALAPVSARSHHCSRTAQAPCVDSSGSGPRSVPRSTPRPGRRRPRRPHSPRFARRSPASPSSPSNCESRAVCCPPPAARSRRR